MEGDIVAMPDRDPEEADSIDSTLAVIQHPLDRSEPVAARTRQEILKEALLLLPNVLKLLFRLLKDPRIPLRRRLAMGAVGLYIASPIDLIPDVVPVLGGIDDVLVLAFAVDYLLESSPEELIAEHWDGSEDGLELIRGIAAWGVEVLPDRIRRLVGNGLR